MRKIKITADSSANLLALDNVSFASVPLKIIAAENEFVDNKTLDLDEMYRFFDKYKGRSQTSCPNASDWLESFEDAEDVFCITITSGLSGSYNTACMAKEMYEEEHPDRRVFVIDSLSAGPELTLLAQKLAELIQQGMAFEEICKEIKAYQKKTGLVFMLESLKNFAANGRVSPAVAKIAGVLGIRVVGKASDEGTLEPLHKCRGVEKSLQAIVNHLKENGLHSGKVQIAHCLNETAAQKLKEMIASVFPKATVNIGINRGLCSYYAEIGGLLVGFERC